MTSSFTGVALVTVAVRRPSPRIAISPKKSPGPSVARLSPSDVTVAVPSMRMKNV